MKADMLPAVIEPAKGGEGLPALVAQAGSSAEFAWDELFAARLRNPNTRRAYRHAVRQFLEWCEGHALELRQVTPGWVGAYYDQLPLSIPTKKQHLAALRCFFDRLVLRHAVALNPAASVRGERYRLTEGKTPEISVEQERLLLTSIPVDDVAGQRDRAIVAVLIYTAARVGAVARLRIDSYTHDGSQWVLNFFEKGGKARIIPVRDDLGRLLSAYLAAAGLGLAPRDQPLFRRLNRGSGAVKPAGMTADDMGRMLKRRMAALGFPTELCPHSFRVATITDLLGQGVPLEEVQQLVGHADPRTTRLYDRRPKRVMRSVVDRISV